ncbi:MAG TPA: MBL fold metallo-hydrolase, partial [Roseiflexaceae bacterium]|nr:MBL fold metallo-hydrolase [Roseiflexaceae bacterium]
VHEHFPHVPIYATPATIRLIEVMLADALRVMERRAAEELEIPLYDAALVASMLRSLRPLALGEHTLPELPNVSISATRAGHVAGAIGLGFAAPDGRLVVSGDVSMTPQRTILGAAAPALRHPDLLILESTYGARMHPNRQAEERRLAQAVAEGVQQGHVLVPAFALGRAQEIILILRAAQRDGQIPEFPIFVDGLVRTVCAAYAGFPEALTPALRNHILRGGRPFFSGTVKPIETPMQRERILAGPPCCIIASSGMLTGGPSAFFAARLLDRPDASILITGYQDEEAPGRKLLDAASGSAGTLMLEGKPVTLRCRVEKYALSAHADGAELAGLVGALKPRAVALVHGDSEARAALAARLRDQTAVLLPRDGETLSVGSKGVGERGSRGVRANNSSLLPYSPIPLHAMGEGAPLDTAGLEQLWQALGDGSGVQTFGVRDISRAWYGEAAGELEERQTEHVLEAAQAYFAPLPGVPGLWRARTPVEARRAQAAGAQAAGGRTHPRVDQMAIQAIVDRQLAQAPDLYRRGVDAESGAVTLGFYFPDVAGQRYADQIAAIAEETGVSVTIAPQPHQGMLAEAALAALPEGLTTSRAPSILFDERAVRVRCDGSAEPDAIHQAQQRFEEQTGWRLELALTAQPEVALQAAPPSDAPERLKMNLATWAAQELFGPETGCYKIGADQQAGILILRFEFPDVAGAHYADQIAELARATGWQVQVHPQAHQGALDAAARAALPDGMTLVGAPSIAAATREVTLRCRGEADPAAVAAAKAAFTEKTGWNLVIRAAS